MPQTPLTRPPGDAPDAEESRTVVHERRFKTRDLAEIDRKLKSEGFTGKMVASYSQGTIGAVTAEQKQSVS